mgnify:CR=1 FL=1
MIEMETRIVPAWIERTTHHLSRIGNLGERFDKLGGLCVAYSADRLGPL